MPKVSIEVAIQRAREALSLGTLVPGDAVYVARLDRPGTGYYLVWFGAENATRALAAVDAADAEVLSHASLPASGPNLGVTAEEALQLARVAAIGNPRLVWRPCQASFSMLSPFWEVGTAPGPIYVDQQRRVWTELKAGGPGG